MKAFADFEKSQRRHVICDFVAPTNKVRESFAADCLIWMDTIKKSRYPRLNRIFEKAKKYDVRINDKDSKLNLMSLPLFLLKYVVTFIYSNNDRYNIRLTNKLFYYLIKNSRFPIVN